MISWARSSRRLPRSIGPCISRSSSISGAVCCSVSPDTTVGSWPRTGTCDARQRFEPEFFDRWLALFVGAVDAEWTGPVADAAKAHAHHMAAVLARRLDVDYQVASAT